MINVRYSPERKEAILQKMAPPMSLTIPELAEQEGISAATLYNCGNRPEYEDRFYKAVTDAHLSHILKVDLTAETFNYVLDRRALDRARMLDGKLLLVTNMASHEPPQIVERYRILAEVERGFRVLKSDIEIAPVYHRLPDHIRAHALICFLALVLYRVLRVRLKASDHPLSPTRALEIVRKIQFHQITLHRRETASGLTKLKPEQYDLFEAIGLPAPTASR
ncbi:hypothetical protein Q427_20285 [Halomonas sp. BC04]|nr:hypothetical protein Q427_20285 [Halomonas sp. BC04]